MARRASVKLRGGDGSVEILDSHDEIVYRGLPQDLEEEELDDAYEPIPSPYPSETWKVRVVEGGYRQIGRAHV